MANLVRDKTPGNYFVVKDIDHGWKLAPSLPHAFAPDQINLSRKSLPIKELEVVTAYLGYSKIRSRPL